MKYYPLYCRSNSLQYIAYRSDDAPKFTMKTSKTDVFLVHKYLRIYCELLLERMREKMSEREKEREI